MTSTDYEKEPLEIMKGSSIYCLPNDATKDTIRIQYIGEQKVMTWNEYVEITRKEQKKLAKAKIKKQLEKQVAEKTESEVKDGDDNGKEEEKKTED